MCVYLGVDNGDKGGIDVCEDGRCRLRLHDTARQQPSPSHDVLPNQLGDDVLDVDHVHLKEERKEGKGRRREEGERERERERKRRSELHGDLLHLSRQIFPHTLLINPLILFLKASHVIR